ncbi:MAG: response regulator transcription factor [Planctomycetota bacterium]
MRKDIALYIGSDCVRQNCLAGHLHSLGIDLHKVSSISLAQQKLCEHKYVLLLIQFESVRRHIIDFCRFIRHEHYEAVILVLMAKAMPIIESKLFECGVDDIVAGKHTLPATLKSRIKTRLAKRLSLPKTNKILLKGGAVVDLERREVRLNGFHHKLNGVSYKLFKYFLENAYRVISREELVKSYIWDNSVCSPDKVEQGRAIDMAVTRLRKLIETDPSNPHIITTVHGIGWILAHDAIM